MILKITIRQRIHCDAVTVASRTISTVVVAVTIGWCNVQGAVTVVRGIVATSCCRTLGTRGGESCATTPLFTRPTLPAQTAGFLLLQETVHNELIGWRNVWEEGHVF